MGAAGGVGRVEHWDVGLRWRVVFPDVEHAGASSYLRELAASDCSPATIRSHAYALLRWFRFLHDRFVGWERAERADVRAFVERLREAPNPQWLRRRPDAPAAGVVNPRTGKLPPGGQYAARTINHQLTVLLGFYEHACAAGMGPLVNPVPAHRGRDGGRVLAHHNPMEDFVVRRRASYCRRHRSQRGGRSRTTRRSSCSVRCAATGPARWCRSGCRRRGGGGATRAAPRRSRRRQADDHGSQQGQPRPGTSPGERGLVSDRDPGHCGRRLAGLGLLVVVTTFEMHARLHGRPRQTLHRST
jgi:hypothetical protein